MSWYAIAWAEKAAPVANAYERLVVTYFAHRADKDGCNAFPSAKTVADYALASVRTIERTISDLRDRGIIALGDQAAARNIDPRYRPKVYDLQIPASWYSPDQLQEVNEERAAKGLRPLTTRNRPKLTGPPAKKRRADVGRPRPKKAGEDDAAADDDLPAEDPEGADTAEVRLQVGTASSDSESDLSVSPDYKSPSDPTTSPDQVRLQDGQNNAVVLNVSCETRGGAPNATPEANVPDDAAPPSPLRADWNRPETCLCSEHLAAVLADPGVDIPACVKCRRVRQWGEQKRAAAAADLVADDAALAAGCTWHDEARWVVDPATGAPFEHPAVRCDHRTTSPESVQAAIAARQRGAGQSSTEEGRARARAIANRRSGLSGPQATAECGGVPTRSATGRARGVREPGGQTGSAVHGRRTPEPATT